MRSGTLHSNVDLARRLARLPLLVVMIAACVALVTVGTRAAAPHTARLFDAVERDRDHIEIDLRPGAQRTQVFDADGNPIGILLNDIDREIITLDHVPDDVIATIVAVEDSKFWLHNGVDLRATARALVSNVSAGQIASGGSTITQQIVKLRVVGSERSFNRKIREAVIAARLEEEFSKEQILEFYVNEVYLGNGAYGLQAGAETYFGKNVSELDVGDAALLASLIRSPGLFDGFDQNIETMTRRRSRSLQQAVDAGIITEAEQEAFERRPLPSRNLSPRRTDVALRRDYFLVEVRQALLANPALGDTYQARFSQVFGGGLRVWTTLRPELQAAMRASVAEVLPEGTGEFEVSIASVDPATGAVHGFIGGPAFSDSEFNLATQGRRQPGSSFKTYVLAAAIERAGLYPFDTISGQGPCVFPNPPQDDYEVNNFGRSAGRVATLEDQTTASSNCAFVRLGLITGLDEVVGTANRLVGRTGENGFLPYPSISLGAQEMSPLEQAVAYGTFANGGVRMEPYYVTRIENSFGEVLYEHVPRGRRVVSSTTADWVTAVLAQNVRSGTGTRSALESGQVSAGKTGTTQSFHDAWFVGYTPQMATAVWMGHPDEQVPMGEIQGRRATGGWIPARVWSAYMGRALSQTPLRAFAPPPPPSRAGQYLFLPGDTCSIEAEVSPAESPAEFDLPCSMVRPTGAGEFEPLADALCNVAVPTGDGGTRLEWLRCARIADELAARATQPVDDAVEDGTEDAEGSERPDGTDGTGADESDAGETGAEADVNESEQDGT
ncbi:transglycosylase domain-containing protein [Candidatus Poriferisodalis sp.]|uniref:transglycosylase domain-containing protein n=1 Tax=Candidatus Poriferisodalis sp. TaxID=3101277 RepID=UPI003B012765